MTLVTNLTTIANLETKPVQSLPGATLPFPLKIGDFGDQDHRARILSLNKTNFELNTCPALKIGDFDDYSKFINNTNEIITRARPSLKMGDFGD